MLKVKQVVVRFWSESGYCPAAASEEVLVIPKQVLVATGAVGVSVKLWAKMLAADPKHRLRILYHKITELFKAAFDPEIAAGGFSQADKRLGKKARPLYVEQVGLRILKRSEAKGGN